MRESPDQLLDTLNLLLWESPADGSLEGEELSGSPWGIFSSVRKDWGIEWPTVPLKPTAPLRSHVDPRGTAGCQSHPRGLLVSP